jgi:isopentenyl diphosphate isomerase/L-lactate dehydrogenase-like FMN-dependent dehydrogenase
VVTLDLQMLGQRHKDLRNGLSVPPRLTLANIAGLARKPRWCLGMLRTRRHSFGNLIGHVKGASDMRSLAAWIEQQFDPRLSWDDIAWIRKLWGGKLVLKGIMDPEDALRAIDAGADAIVVSNHGGRQLDGAPSSIRALPPIVKAAGSQAEIWFDGGIRSGQDVFRAVALGAKGVLIGRAYLYGLGAMGEAGVRLCLKIIAKELSATMGFCGASNINDVNAGMLAGPLPCCATFPAASGAG